MKSNKVDAIGFLVLVVLAGAGYFGLIHGTNQRLKATKDDIAEYTRATLANDGLENILEQDKLDLQPLESKFSEHAEGLISRKQLDDFMRNLAASAQQAGVTVSLLRPGEPEKCSWYEFTPINMNLEGAFTGIYQLVRELENGSALATLNTLYIQSEPGKPQCRATLTFHVYLKADGV